MRLLAVALLGRDDAHERDLAAKISRPHEAVRMSGFPHVFGHGVLVDHGKYSTVYSTHTEYI